RFLPLPDRQHDAARRRRARRLLQRRPGTLAKGEQAPAGRVRCPGNGHSRPGPPPHRASEVRRVPDEACLPSPLPARPEDDEHDADPASDPPRTEPVPLLSTEEHGFKIILGGINGVNVSGRSHSLNASVAMVQRKLAALAADYVVTNDLALPDGQRKLLNGVAGAEDPIADEAALRAAIAGLVRRLYGQRVAPDAAPVTGWLQLYRSLFDDRTQGGT